MGHMAKIIASFVALMVSRSGFDIVPPHDPVQLTFPLTCDVEETSNGKLETPTWITRFRALPLKEQASIFARLSEGQQIEFAVCIMQSTEPADLRWEFRIVSLGESAVPGLIDALARDDDHLAVGVLEILSHISLTRYDLRRNPCIMKIMDRRVARIEDAPARDHATKLLAQIRQRKWKINSR